MCNNFSQNPLFFFHLSPLCPTDLPESPLPPLFSQISIIHPPPPRNCQQRYIFPGRGGAGREAKWPYQCRSQETDGTREVSLPKRGYRVSVAEGQANAGNHRVTHPRAEGKRGGSHSADPRGSIHDFTLLPPSLFLPVLPIGPPNWKSKDMKGL